MSGQIEGLETRQGRVFLDGQDVSDITVRMQDVMRAGHCVSGTVAWFANTDMPFREFVREGVSAAKFLGTKDAMALDIVRLKLLKDAE